MAIDARWAQVVLISKDFERTKAFYGGALGLPVFTQWDREGEGRGVIYRCGAAYIEVLDEAAAANVADVSDGHDVALVAQPAGLLIGVPDVDSLYDEMTGLRAGPMSSLWDAPWGHRGFRVADPDGFVVTFFSGSEGGSG